MSTFSQIKYSGATPGADSGTYNLYDSTSGTGSGARQFGANGCHVFILDLKNSQAGTLKIYKGSYPRDTAGATTYSQIEQFTVPAAPTAESNKYEFLVEPYSDWKLDWVNGGAAQVTWLVDMALTDQRASAGRSPDPSTFQSVGAATTANVKAAAGSLLSLTATNRNGAARYLQIYNTTGATTPVFYQWVVPASAMIIVADDFFITDKGWPLSTGITWGMSTTAGSYVAATAIETDVAGSYR